MFWTQYEQYCSKCSNNNIQFYQTYIDADGELNKQVSSPPNYIHIECAHVLQEYITEHKLIGTLN